MRLRRPHDITSNKRNHFKVYQCLNACADGYNEDNVEMKGCAHYAFGDAVHAGGDAVDAYSVDVDIGVAVRMDVVDVGVVGMCVDTVGMDVDVDVGEDVDMGADTVDMGVDTVDMSVDMDMDDVTVGMDDDTVDMDVDIETKINDGRCLLGPPSPSETYKCDRSYHSSH